MSLSTSPSKTERIHALDSLRAIMMLLGLVIHSAITYGIFDYGNAWTIKDPNHTGVFMDYTVALIHSFRMPIFFVVAGFFGAMLFFERSPVKMFKNRIDRILYPFIVFVFILSIAIIFSAAYTQGVFAGASDPFELAIAPLMILQTWLPPSTYHLWFLYYLLLITLASFLLALVFNRLPKFTNGVTSLLNQLLERPVLKVIVFSLLTVGLLFLMGGTWVKTSIEWTPDSGTFFFYFFFYGIGWILFKSKHLLHTFMQYDWMYFILGVVLKTVSFFFPENFNFELVIVLNSLIVWLLIFGITGLFIRYGSQHSMLMRYNSDSSYWIYLIHLPFTFLLPGLIADWNLPAFAKFILVLLMTSVISLITYHYLVRNTFIGKFLNGRKYSRQIFSKKVLVPKVS